jgi:hypothetical protein
MNGSRYSPSSASMICASRPVPSVVTTSAWVSPRVNSAEPWVRGSTPVRMVIGRTVLVSRPSMRGCAIEDFFLGKRADRGLQVECSLPALPCPRALPASAASSLIALIATCICSWPNMTAPSMIVFVQALGLGFDHQHAFAVPATTRSSLRFGELGRGGIQNVLAVHVADARRADRAHERHAGNGQRRRGAEQRGDVGIDFGFDRQHEATTCTSLMKPSGNSGRIGRSMRREVSVSFSVGRPSRLKKPPGMLAGGVGLFLVVDGEREEIAARTSPSSGPPR